MIIITNSVVLLYHSRCRKCWDTSPFQPHYDTPSPLFNVVVIQKFVQCPPRESKHVIYEETSVISYAFLTTFHLKSWGTFLKVFQLISATIIVSKNNFLMVYPHVHIPYSISILLSKDILNTVCSYTLSLV